MRNLPLTLFMSLTSLSLGLFHFNTRADECVKPSSMAQFISNGQFTPPGSSWGPSTDPCDEFGADQIFSKRYGINIIVSFNIPLILDLDLVELAFEAYALRHQPNDIEKLRSLNLVFVSSKKLKSLGGSDAEYVVLTNNSYYGRTLYISTRVLNERLLLKLLTDLYQLKCPLTYMAMAKWPGICN